jgi:hypothetical protein
VVLYVDDMLLIGNNKKIIKDVKVQLSFEFDMKDLGATNFILNMKIKKEQANMKLWFNQRKYVETILQSFNTQECTLVKVPIPIGVRLSTNQCHQTQEEIENISRVPYANFVGSLIYAMVYTRPDIDHEVEALSRYMSKPGNKYWTTIKRVFRYLCGISNHAICYQGRPKPHKDIDLHGFFMDTVLEILTVEDL